MRSLPEIVAAYLETFTAPGLALKYKVAVSLAAEWKAGKRRPTAAVYEDAHAAQPPAAPPEILIPECSWEGKRLALLLPWYKAVHPATAYSVMAMVDRQKMGIIMAHGDAFISHSRNALAQQFLSATQCEWALMVDDDMVLPFGHASWFNRFTGMDLPESFAGLHTINRLVTRGKTLVGGLYFGRNPTGRPMYAEGSAYQDEAALVRRSPRDEVKPTKWVATGCLLIHRSVFTDIDAKYPELKQRYFSPTEADLVRGSKEAVALLEQGDVAGGTAALGQAIRLSESNSPLALGEDVTFCVRAAAAGHQPHVDLGLICGHIGNAVYGPHNTKYATA